MTAASERRVTYVVLGLIFLLLVGVGVAIYHTNKENDEARRKAAELSAELASAGVRVPTTSQIVSVLGDDGGAVCHDPGNALAKGILYGQLTNGATGPGQRPVIADNKVVHGQLLIIKVYCPEKLAEFQQVVDGLKLADVA
ncbi:hypothetical protein BJ973_002248 [Actinoplanes tereljensis]|uniref:Uncharacterized protein n=1 Tax=Paractinoplanes tereljensis TaxID=571912 RepID=A0A919TVG0_9ACTN|nr:hypothetical protein [Actinoplanes tereljensis]GIF21922.1 hypothetical protein Ate02nite_46520 [Actinoplanes tereljensis]